MSPAKPKSAASKPAERRTRSKRTTAPPARPASGSFPIVGIGASAGGLEALQELFEHMPPNPGMAFVVVTHQHPGHTSLLPELLAKCTVLPVVEAADGMPVALDHVYVAPPGGHLDIFNGVLQRFDADSLQPPHLPVDHFLRSLATDRKEKAVCIILSGTATDGTLGLQAIKRESGMVMVQQVESAKYAGMPSSALATNLVDYALSPKDMPAQLMAYVKGPYLATPRNVEPAVDPSERPSEPLQKILLLLRTRTGNDFSNYKTSTIRRRIERRMNVHHLDTAAQYVRFLQENPHEIDLLFKELLISVTTFFRDPEAFAVMETQVLPELLKSRPENYLLRAWIVGCATGEEVYSIGMLVREAIAKADRALDVQLFGTDLDAEAIDVARAGRYPDGIAVDVSAPRLERYFKHADGGYQIRKDIRELAVFAVQNVIKDPPFTKLDLIACRNLLIYLNGDQQKRLLPLFHYALKPGGILFLGPSETVGSHSDLFEAVDKKWKIYRRKELPTEAASLVDFPAEPARLSSQQRVLHPPVVRETPNIASLVERLLLTRFAPASVVVNERGDVVFIHGRTGAWLEPPAGQPRLNINDMAREGLQFELLHALRQAVVQGAEVARPDIRVHSNGDGASVDLSVAPITEPEPLRGLFLVTFRPGAAHEVRATEEAKPSQRDLSRIEQLERELQYSKESLQTTIEELETSNEELKSTNEELQSTNEELQSTNEELETSKEEMQSLNEELTTVNAELHSKVEELSRTNDDMQNLLNSTEIATIFLDRELKIKRYTERAVALINLIQTDVGRPLSHLVSNLDYDDLEQDCNEVLRTLVFQEAEVRTRDGRWYLMRIMPYRTAENVIDGLVLTFVDINPLKTAEEAVMQTRLRLAADVASMTRMLEISSLYLRGGERGMIFDEVLEAALTITEAKRGVVCLVDRTTGRLGIVALRGFKKPWMRFAENTDLAAGACGRALADGKRVIAENIETSAIFAGTPALPVHLKAGVRAMQATPLITRGGQPLGVVSTYFDVPHRPDKRSLQLLDLLARLTVEMLDHASAASVPGEKEGE